MENRGEADYREKWMEQRFANVEQKVAHQAELIDQRMNRFEERMASFETRLEGQINHFIAEMRDRDNQRHQEIAELRQTISTVSQTNKQIFWALVGVLRALVMGFVAVLVTLGAAWL